MELWFSDYHTEKVKVSVKVQKQLFGLQTEFQRIDVFDSDEFGRFLSADGSIVFSEKDEFIYDEMVVHIPMAVHPNVKHVLVIGGGDGGVARELGHYKRLRPLMWWNRIGCLWRSVKNTFRIMPADCQIHGSRSIMKTDCDFCEANKICTI